MIYITRFVILFWILLFSFHGRAQNATQCLAIAEDLHAIGDYNEAIRMYRRVLFFDEALAATSYFHIGESYLSTQQFEQARYFFDLAQQSERSDSVKHEIWFRTVASYILEGKVLYAQNQLLAYSLTGNTYFDHKYHFYQGIVFFKQQDLGAAEAHFSHLFTADQISELENLIQQGQKIVHKNPMVAMVLSALLPGAGQAYAGEWVDAANSFFINALTTTLYVYVLSEYAIVDAVLAVLPWWHRYYVGGFTNARDMVKDKRADKLDAVLTDVLLLYSLSLTN